jgi:hypothetical protein
VTGRRRTFVFVPRGVAPTFRVCTDTARMLAIRPVPGGAPAGGLEAFFRAASTPAPAAVLPSLQAPDPVALTALAANYGIEFLPPPA